MELFFEFCPCKIYGITGSDGKTTTTSVIAELLSAAGKTVHLGGNIGKPLFPQLETIRPEDVAVAELSSFQLISMRRSPDVVVVTNVSPNHLDIHKDMDEYVLAKMNVFLHQNAFGKAVFNEDNDITLGFVSEARGQALTFSRQKQVPNGAWVDDEGFICMNDTRVMRAEDIKIPGLHNLENYWRPSALSGATCRWKSSGKWPPPSPAWPIGPSWCGCWTAWPITTTPLHPAPPVP